jgi:hypothetical protein
MKTNLVMKQDPGQKIQPDQPITAGWAGTFFPQTGNFCRFLKINIDRRSWESPLITLDQPAFPVPCGNRE